MTGSGCARAAIRSTSPSTRASNSSTRAATRGRSRSTRRGGERLRLTSRRRRVCSGGSRTRKERTRSGSRPVQAVAVPEPRVAQDPRAHLERRGEPQAAGRTLQRAARPQLPVLGVRVGVELGANGSKPSSRTSEAETVTTRAIPRDGPRQGWRRCRAVSSSEPSERWWAEYSIRSRACMSRAGISRSRASFRRVTGMETLIASRAGRCSRRATPKQQTPGAVLLAVDGVAALAYAPQVRAERPRGR